MKKPSATASRRRSDLISATVQLERSMARLFQAIIDALEEPRGGEATPEHAEPDCCADETAPDSTEAGAA